MLTLTQSQDSVGRALHRGQLFIQSGKLSQEEAQSISQKMVLINSKWEALRQGAMDRQTRYSLHVLISLHLYYCTLRLYYI